MQTKRIIPCLDIKDGRVVKGTNFQGLQDVDDPVALAAYYNQSGADELVFYDITASAEGRALFTDVLAEVAKVVTLPLMVGGSINALSDFERVFEFGAKKVSVNSGAIKNPDLVKEAAQAFGGERVVLSMDVKRVGGKFVVFARGGRDDTGLCAIDWAKKGEQDGASELVLNSIDTDGVQQGFDLEMLEAVCAVLRIPVIASGGAGNKAHFLELFRGVPGVGAGLAASIFHRKELAIRELKEYLKGEGIPVRL